MTSDGKYYFGFVRLVGAALWALLLAGLFVGTVSDVYAVLPEIRIDLINGQPPTSYSCPDRPLSNPVVIMGSGQGSTPPGRVEQYGVQVDWGDGSPIEIANSTFTPPSGRGVDFAYVFETPSHTYPNGSFTLSISLFHSQPGGKDNQIDSTVTFQVCTFNPVAPTIQLDLINGEEPDSFSCPDDPVQNPVVISGSGEGSAPPAAVENYFVSVNWGDGTPSELTVADFTPSSGSGVNFTYEFDSLDHSYTAGGNYDVTIALEYSNPGGPGNLVAASQTFSICAFTPVTPTLQVDSVNGQNPDTLSCPDSPLLNPVVIAGGGQAPAPPGNVEDYIVYVNWGDGSAVEATITTLTPPTGTLVNFAYDFETLEHTYEVSGSYTIGLSLVYAAASGDQTIMAQSIDICVRNPQGTVTGEVLDLETGLPIFGSRVEDITPDVTLVPGQIIGSFPGGSTYVIDTPPGLRTIRVSVQGWEDGIAQVTVVEDQVSFLDFALTRVETALNDVEVTIPLGTSGKKIFVIPDCVEVVDANGQFVAITCAHAGPIFWLPGLEDGDDITFRTLTGFYTTESFTKDLDFDEKDNGDDAPNKSGRHSIKLSASVPQQQPSASVMRVPVITGGVAGVTSFNGSPTATIAYADFDFEGQKVTVSSASNVDTGVYAIDLLPAGQQVDVYAHATNTSARSVDTPANIVGGQFTQVNLAVLPYDAADENDAPVITGADLTNTDEDVPLVVNIDDFTVIDPNNVFSQDHQLLVSNGFNFTRSNITPNSVQIDPKPNYSGTIAIPVTVSDGVSLSSPFDLMIQVNAVPDIEVYVDFDTGTSAGSGARGTNSSPFSTVADALTVVSPGGSILISGLTTSTEPPFVINQPVTLENNNPGGEVVTINPSVVALQGVKPTSQTGFVSRSTTP